jgi:hypothetical protein
MNISGTTIIKARDIALALDSHPFTVQQWVQRGKFPAYDVNITRAQRGWLFATIRAFNPIIAAKVEAALRFRQQQAQRHV